MKKILLSFLSILMVVILAACQEEDSEGEESDRVIPVEVAEIKKGDLVTEKTVTLKAMPNERTAIMLQYPGEIDSIEKQNGDEVSKDTIIGKVKTPAGTSNIRAPKAGELAHFNVSVGDIVSETEPLAFVVKTEKMILNGSVTGDVRSYLEKDKKLTAVIDGTEYEAKVISVDSMQDETGLYPVQARIDNKDNDVIAGMAATLHIPKNRIKDTLIIPTEAVVEEDDEAFIYIINKDHVVKTKVTIKETQSDQTAIEGEVKEGDQVVMNGQLTLTDGSKIEVVKEGN